MKRREFLVRSLTVGAGVGPWLAMGNVLAEPAPAGPAGARPGNPIAVSTYSFWHFEATLKKVEDEDFGYCESCGVEIGIRRLEARPTADLCIDCKTLAEIREKQMAG